MNDIIQSIKAYLYDRAVSPLIGAFVTSWLVCNYRIVLIILGGSKETKLEDKFQMIDTYFAGYKFQLNENASSIEGWIVAGIIYPSLLSCIYLFLYPWPAQYVYNFSLDRQKALVRLKQEKEDNVLLTREQSQKIRKEMREIEKLNNDEVESLREEIVSNKAEIKSLLKTISEYEESPENSDEEEIELKLSAMFDTEITPNQLLTNIENLHNGIFKIDDIFTEHNGFLTDEEALTLEKGLNKAIFNNLIPDIDILDKSSNPIKYVKKDLTVNLDSDSKVENKKIELLSCLLKNDDDHSYSAHLIQQYVSSNLEEVKVYLNDLAEDEYLDASDDIDPHYSISNVGRRFMVINNLINFLNPQEFSYNSEED